MEPTRVGETYPPSQIPSIMPSMMPTQAISQAVITTNVSFAGTPQEQQQLAEAINNYLSQYGK